VFTLEGLGMPILQKNGRGDLKVKVQVEMSSRLSKRGRETGEEINRQNKKGKTGDEEASFQPVEN